MRSTLVDAIRDTGIDFAPGLTDIEIEDTQLRFGFRFPPDLRAFLQTALPLGDRFPDWRNGDVSGLEEWLDLPRRGIAFDIESNGFWLDEWGPRPATLEAALEISDGLIAAAPKLIPIYLHRMMPAEPHLPGNPIFSVHQTDIIYYGMDLRDYLIREFLAREGIAIWPMPGEPRPIEFWDLERFQNVRWANGPVAFDNRDGTLP